jgi:hypothetical protein
MIDICTVVCVLELIILLHILYLINYKTINLYLKENFVIKQECAYEPKLFELREKLKPMFADDVVYTGALANINKKKILNDITLCSGDKSYTINKEDVYMCLKDEHNQYYHDNMLMYVLIHEVSHLVCKSIGHTTEFHEKFQLLLQKAIEMKIYDPTIPVIKDYCLYKK